MRGPLLGPVRALPARQFEHEFGGQKPMAGRDEIVRTMQELLAGAANEAKQKPSMADVRAYFEQQAAALGIDLDDPNDRIAEVVRIGLEDLDPTRVSRNCRHIHLRPEARGVPSEMLGLVMAGSKSITCLKHGHSMQGLKLDVVYGMFSQRMPWGKDGIRCENCPDRDPHPADWNWSEEWEIAQAAHWAEQRGKKNTI